MYEQYFVHDLDAFNYIILEFRQYQWIAEEILMLFGVSYFKID